MARKVRIERAEFHHEGTEAPSSDGVGLFCVGLFPENGCRFFLNDGGRDPIISGPRVVQYRFMLSPNSAWCPVSAVQPSVQAPQPLTPQRHRKNAEITQGSSAKKLGQKIPVRGCRIFLTPSFCQKDWLFKPKPQAGRRMGALFLWPHSSVRPRAPPIYHESIFREYRDPLHQGASRATPACISVEVK